MKIIFSIILITFINISCVTSAAGAMDDMNEFDNFISSLKHSAEEYSRQDFSKAHESLNRTAECLNRLPRNSQNTLMKQDFQKMIAEQSFSRVHGEGKTNLEIICEEIKFGFKGALYQHLVDALELHEKRIPYYSKKTGGLSDPVFKKLSAIQRANLPVARYIDMKALPFQKEGIPIISGDILPMNCKPMETPSLYHGTISKEDAESYRKKMIVFQRKCASDLNKHEYLKIAEKAYNMLQETREFEKSRKVHFAMTIHMLQSLGYSSMRSAKYYEMSNGRTSDVSRMYLSIQVIPLQEAISTDINSHPSHAKGAGIMINDVPEIPFESEWESRMISMN
ncbi:MAG: hypothetical protein HQM10_22705 [Candidatus Riflebacteria bacterium]|nr:hypothetical protein [Candidatus Riflebacteria bacterium]